MNDPWTCKICGGEMIKTSKNHLVCALFHGRLHRAPKVEDLPLAIRAFCRDGKCFLYTKLFLIAGQEGYWKYIPYAHKKALDQRPKAGTVIARVLLRGGRVQARAFRLSGRPRKSASQSSS